MLDRKYELHGDGVIGTVGFIDGKFLFLNIQNEAEVGGRAERAQENKTEVLAFNLVGKERRQDGRFRKTAFPSAGHAKAFPCRIRA